jgi:hypothetical protein
MSVNYRGICFITLAPSFRYCMDKFGWNPEEGDGLMAAGGSMSNFYGMVRKTASVFFKMFLFGLLKPAKGQYLLQGTELGPNFPLFEPMYS